MTELGSVLGWAAVRFVLVDRGLNYTQAVERAYQSGQLGRPRPTLGLGELYFKLRIAPGRDTR